jgi:hypothetical protein
MTANLLRLIYRCLFNTDWWHIQLDIRDFVGKALNQGFFLINAKMTVLSCGDQV